MSGPRPRRHVVAVTTAVLVIATVVVVAPAGASGRPWPKTPTAIPVKVREFAVVPTTDHTSRSAVTFVVRNAGTETHELVLARLQGTRPLAVDADGAADEGSIAEADALGEAEDIGAGRTKRFIATGLTPGAYELFCNIVETDGGETVSHYAKGMHTVFVVN